MKMMSIIAASMAFASVASAQRAGDMITTPQLNWETKQVQLQVTGNSAQTPGIQTISLDLNRTWQEYGLIPDPGPCYAEIPQTVTYIDYENCNSVGGSGKSPAWDAYFSAKKEDKVAALADAIAGVGKPTATKLIAAGYFSSKPRSWSAFASELKSAANAGVIPKSVYTEAVETTYQAQNMTNLGYVTTGISCPTASSTEWVRDLSQPVTCADKILAPVSMKQKLDSAFVHVGMTVQGAVLQQQLGETDTVTAKITVDPTSPMKLPIVTGVTGGSYNNYTYSSNIQDNNVMINVQATGRNRVQMPDPSTSRGALGVNGHNITFSLNVDPRYEGSGNDQLVVVYYASYCDKNFFGFCDGNYIALPAQTAVLTSIDGHFSAPAITIPQSARGKKQKAKVTYNLIRRNSPYYNSNKILSSDVDTDAPDLK